MNYLLIENKTLVGVLNYRPNISGDNVQIIEYSGSIPQDRILYIDEKIVDGKDYIFVNGKYVKNTNAISDIALRNNGARGFLANTDWLVMRHRDQLELGIETSLTQEQYLDLLNKRQEARKKVVEYDI